MGTCNGLLIIDIGVELVGKETSVPSPGSALSVVPVLFIIGFEKAQVVCVSDWKPAVIFFGFSEQ